MWSHACQEKMSVRLTKGWRISEVYATCNVLLVTSWVWASFNLQLTVG